ncbi:hypothetical protein [Roseiterribacter gracilis]|uniref:Dienelactone hydrolase domain-containing protein n=1 Tax=Roseiterribacter gracilis TaxID=2812848 RepID=A0A8S8X7S3_9PROT|nr:hypothetical protein TMPK1_20450 [Rhodospirillales bacterium TMPK1]
MRFVIGLLALVLFGVGPALAEDATAHRFTAAGSPMDYYVSLPAGWTPERTWPVIVALPDATREFTTVMDAFIAARRSKPWIIVVPVVLGSGGVPWRFADVFGYKPDVFEKAEKDGVCKFDHEGLAAVLQDVRKRFKAEGRAFITGYEAAGHVIWREVIHNPAAYYGAALVFPNFAGRCVDETQIKTKTTTPLSIEILRGGDDKVGVPGSPIDLQIKSAVDYVRGIGHKVEDVTVPGKVRGPFAEEVFDFMEKVRAGK